MPTYYQEKPLEEILLLYVCEQNGGGITDEQAKKEVQKLLASDVFLVDGYVIHTADAELFYLPSDPMANRGEFIHLHQHCKVFKVKEEAISVASLLIASGKVSELTVAQYILNFRQSIFFPVWSSKVRCEKI